MPAEKTWSYAWHLMDPSDEKQKPLAFVCLRSERSVAVLGARGGAVICYLESGNLEHRAVYSDPAKMGPDIARWISGEKSPFAGDQLETT